MLVKATSAATVAIACAWCSRPLMAQRIGGTPMSAETVQKRF